MPQLNLFPFVDRIPLVPGIMVRGPQSGVLVADDPSSFTENCVVRAIGSGVVGGVMGFVFGAMFSGYGSLQPLDPTIHSGYSSKMPTSRPPIGVSGGRPATVMMAPPALPLPGALPFSHLETPSQPIWKVLKDGLVDVSARLMPTPFILLFRYLLTHVNHSR